MLSIDTSGVIPVMLAVVAVPAFAQADMRADVEQRIAQLNDAAMKGYDELEFESAQGQLEQALELARKGGVDKGSLLVRTLLNLGVVYGAGLGDETAAQQYFVRALRLDPNTSVDATRATPALQTVFDRARHQWREERERAEARRRRRREVAKREEAAAERQRRQADRRAHRFAVSAMVGTGVAVVVDGESENKHPTVSGERVAVGIDTGVAIAPLHLLAEVAYIVSRHWHIGAQARLQVLTLVRGEGVKEHLSLLGMARAKGFLGSDAVWRPYLSVGLGGGTIRHRIKLGDYDGEKETPNGIVDSRVSGFVAMSLGFGLQIQVHRHIAVVAEAASFVLVPDVAIHLDLDAGVQFAF